MENKYKTIKSRLSFIKNVKSKGLGKVSKEDNEILIYFYNNFYTCSYGERKIKPTKDTYFEVDYNREEEFSHFNAI